MATDNWEVYGIEIEAEKQSLTKPSYTTERSNGGSTIGGANSGNGW